MAAFSILLIFPANPAIAQNLQLIGTGGTPPYVDVTDIEVGGNYAFLGTNNTGLLVIDISNPTNPHQVGQLSLPGMLNIFIYDNFLYAVLVNAEMRVIDISNPANPSLIGTYYDAHVCRDIWVAGQYAFIAEDTDGLTVVNIANPANPFLASDVSCAGLGGSLSRYGNYLYDGETTRLEIFNISNPLNIVSVGQDSNSYVSDIFVQDDFLFSTYSHTSIFDISSPANPVAVGSSPLGGYRISISGNYGFIIQALYTSPIDVIDISTPSLPLWAARKSVIPGNYATAVCARNDTAFVGGNSFFAIYGFSGQGKGALEGYVRDAVDNHLLEGAVVTLAQNNLADTTDASGHFILTGLYNLHYGLSITHPDYYSKSDTGFAVIADDTTSYNIALGRGPLIDVGIASMSSPPVVLKTDSTYAIKPLVFNAIAGDTQSFNVVTEVYLINSPNPLFVDTVFVDSLVHAWPYHEIVFGDSLTAQPETTYKIITYTSLPTDENHSNDTLIYYCSSETTQFQVWYGNLDGSPIVASPGSPIYIDVYAKTRLDVHIGTMCLNLGTKDQYIDSLMSRQYGSFYYPITAWDDYSFIMPSHSPPNPPGWSAETFLGYWDLGGAGNPPMHLITPTRIMTMVVQAVYDTSLIGDTVVAFGSGMERYMGPSGSSDTTGAYNFPVTEYFCPLVLKAGCDYMLGDINGDGLRGGGDVTYGVRFFKLIGNRPPDSCYMDSTGTWLYVAGDVNGNCEFRGSDITRMVAYFKGYAQLSYCHFFPPPILREGRNLPVIPR